MRRSFVMRCLLGLAAVLAELEYSHGQSVPVFNPTNGHHYVRFDSPLDWFAAQAAATTSTLAGVNGYLATITSQEENDLITSAFPAGGHWLGGFQPTGAAEPGGGWEWVTGEAWSYTSWGGSEPKEAGGTEDGLNSHGNGQWNDLPRTVATPYIVEYPTTSELFRWANIAGGDVATAPNWSSSYLPATTDPAVFDLGSTGYAVTATQNRSFSQFHVGTDNVTLDLGSNKLDITGTQGQVLRVADGAGDDGVLRITSGSVITRGLGVAATGSSSGTMGLLEIDGPTARLEIAGTFAENQIGGGGDDFGKLVVSGGGQLSSPDAILLLGRNGGSGELKISGENTTANVLRAIVGLNGHGLLEIDAGQMSSARQINVGGSFVGDTAVGVGEMIIRNGGRLSSSHGGTSATNTSGTIGFGSLVRGEATVTDDGSSWFNDGLLNVGLRGKGTLKILSSGEVIAARGVIASEPSSVGTVEVSGTGSMWEIAEDLTVGGTEAAQGGQGLLEVKSGGRVVVGGSYDGELRVWGGGVVDVTALGAVDVGRLTTPGPAGTLTLGGPGVLRGNGLIKGNVDARGWEGLVHEQEEYWATVAPGNATTGIGRLTINGNYTQRDDSFLEIQLAGPQQGVQHDELFVTGHATFDGILSISLNDGFIPVAGDAFKILDWSSHTGTYFHSLPTLPSGLRWNTGQLYSNGTLAVAPMQQTIARWTFEAGKPGNPVSASGTTLSGVSPAIGNGIASGFHASAATVWDNPAGNGSPESMSSNNWTVGDYYQFQINTEDMENIKLEFEQVSSSSGPRDFQLQYSTDGTAFTDFGAPYVVRTNATPAWGASTPSGLDYFYFDLSSLTAISDQSSVFFRLAVESNVSSSGGVIGTGGTSRLDNVTISGTQIVGLAGDFNDDGTVDGVDFLVWQRQLGGSVIPYSGADGDGNAVVNAADLNIWRDRYGNTSGLSSSTTATVPEPASIALFLLSPTLIACRPIRPRVAH